MAVSLFSLMHVRRKPLKQNKQNRLGSREAIQLALESLGHNETFKTAAASGGGFEDIHFVEFFLHSVQEPL